MIKYIRIAVLTILCVLSLCSQSVMACDACSFYEYNTLQNRSYFAAFYRLRQFNGYANGSNPVWRWTPADYRNARISHEVANTANTIWTPSPKDYMRLESIDLRFNHAFDVNLPWTGGADGQKKSLTLNVTAQTGFSRNAYYLADIIKYTGLAPNVYHDSLVQTTGLQDLRLGLSVVHTWFAGDFKQTLNAGILMRVPIANFNANEPNGRLIHPELQAGTGAFDFMPRATYQIIYSDLGLEVSALYRMATTNRNAYRFGKSSNLQADVFYAIPVTEVIKVVPRLGYYYEQEDQHRLDGEAVAGTGGRAGFANLQLDLMYRSWALTTQFQQPVQNKLNGNQLLNAGRLNVGMVYSW